jgi:Tfp pilus assembly protein PilO
MTKSFLDKFSKKEKMIFYAACFIVILAVFDRFIFDSISSRIGAIEDEIRASELLLRKDLRITAQQERILKLQSDFSNYSVQAKSQEEEISGILREIETLATKSSVALIEVKPSGATDEKISKKYSITLTCEGNITQLANFFYAVENSTVLFTIDTYSLTSRDKERGIIRCSMTISKVVVI